VQSQQCLHTRDHSVQDVTTQSLVLLRVVQTTRKNCGSDSGPATKHDDSTTLSLSSWHYSHAVSIELSSVCLSLHPSHQPAVTRRCGGFAAVGPAARRYRSTAARRRSAVNASSITLSTNVWSWTQTGLSAQNIYQRMPSLVMISL